MNASQIPCVWYIIYSLHTRITTKMIMCKFYTHLTNNLYKSDIYQFFCTISNKKKNPPAVITHAQTLFHTQLKVRHPLNWPSLILQLFFWRESCFKLNETVFYWLKTVKGAPSTHEEFFRLSVLLRINMNYWTSEVRSMNDLINIIDAPLKNTNEDRLNTRN